MNREKNFDSCIKVKYRPFVEGSRGCHEFICLCAQPLSAKECHVALPLVIATFIIQSVAFILHHHNFVQRSIFSYTKLSHTFRSNFYCPFALMTSYLRDLAQSLGRYGGHLKVGFGFKGFWMHKQYLYLVRNFWLAKIGGKHHMLKDL